MNRIRKTFPGLWGSVACVIFIGSFYQTFLILAYHFVYRYNALTGFVFF